MNTVDSRPGGHRLPRLATAVALGALLVLFSACSSSDDSSSESLGVGEKVTSTNPTRPSGPAADLSTELTGGDGAFVAVAEPDDLKSVHYTQHEYAAAGTATAYKSSGELTGDGRWTFVPDTQADYRTWILVRTPAKKSDFSGNVIVEWLNVSAGVDSEPEWSNLHEEITRAGDAWVGVSAQAIGVNGGPVAVKVEGVPGVEVAGQGLKNMDPARYGSLNHPGDQYSYDIFTQVERALRAGDGMHDLQPKRIIAAGQSQSAFAMVTYVNGVQPLTKAFDGFFVHSRGGTSLPIVTGGSGADIVSVLAGKPTIFRTDDTTPIMDIQTETDLTSILSAYSARQPDSDSFRLWEVAGTADADLHTVGTSAEYIDCGVQINNAPLHIVAKAAYRSLVHWVTDGTAPPKAPRIQVAVGATPQIERDANGIALGGIRTPPIDVPVAALTGNSGPNPSTICLLLGSTTPLPAATVNAMYPTRADYTSKVEKATDDTIAAGFALKDDRDAMLEFEDTTALPN